MSLSLFSGCANDRNIELADGKKIHATPYGIFDKDEMKKEGVEYKVSGGNVILGVIFFETIIAPIVIFGWYLYEPVGAK